MVDLLNKEMEDLIKELNKRKIKFRGKCLRNNQQWVYGSYVYHLGTIQDENQDFDIDLNTLGQFTGIVDINGKEIYEGDIVKILYTDWASKSDNDTRTLEEYLDSLTKVGVVCWSNLSLGYHLKMRNDCFNSLHCGRYGYIEVIGDIYNNPKLLEK